MNGVRRRFLSFKEDNSTKNPGNIYVRPPYGKFSETITSAGIVSKPIQEVHISLHSTIPHLPHNTIVETVKFKEDAGVKPKDLRTYNKTRAIKNKQRKFAPVFSQICGNMLLENHEVDPVKHARNLGGRNINPALECLGYSVFAGEPGIRSSLKAEGVDVIHCDFTDYTVLVLIAVWPFPSLKPHRLVIRTEPDADDPRDNAFFEKHWLGTDALKDGLEDQQCLDTFLCQQDILMRISIRDCGEVLGKQEDKVIRYFVERREFLVGLNPKIAGFSAEIEKYTKGD